MENKDEIQELSLDDILTEFQDQPPEGLENVELGEELTSLLENLPTAEQMRSTAEQSSVTAALSSFAFCSAPRSRSASNT